MKYFIRNSGAGLLILVLLFSCIGSPDVKKEKSPDPEKKAMNTIKNTTIIIMGSMQLAFNRSFKEHSDAFSVALSEELNDDSIAMLDEKILGMGDATLLSLEEMIDRMDAKFDELSKIELTLSQKMALHDIMSEGVAITEKYKLPYGFRPLSQDLSSTELKRYIVKVTADYEKQEDSIIQTYKELFQWLQIVNEEFGADPQMRDFIKSIRD